MDEARFEELLKRHINFEFNEDFEHITYTYDDVCDVLDKAEPIFKEEPTLIEMRLPCIVVGDILGQYFDLMRIFGRFTRGHRHGCRQARYVFLGNVIDRGKNSLECIMLLLTLKCLFPMNFGLIRGNHEDAPVNRSFGFFSEINTRFPVAQAEILFDRFNALFMYMPLACRVGKTILCIHAGLGKNIKTLDDIKTITRPLSGIKEHPIAVDLLWADPLPGTIGYTPNVVRDVSVFFGEDTVREFCKRNDLQLIIRGHQMMASGYGFFCNRRLLTLFSSTNYTEVKDNKAAVCVISKAGKMSFKIFLPRNSKAKDESKEYIDSRLGISYHPENVEAPANTEIEGIVESKQRNTTIDAEVCKKKSNRSLKREKTIGNSKEKSCRSNQEKSNSSKRKQK